MTDRVTQLIESIQTARRMTDGLLEGIAPDWWFHQPVPTGQHIAWIVGHLARADDWALIALGCPNRFLDDFAPCFNRDQAITANPASYPPIDSIRAAYEDAHLRFLERMGQISDDDLSRKTSGPIADFAPDLGTLLDSHVWHEGFHTGQLALIRRSLGLPIRWG